MTISEYNKIEAMRVSEIVKYAVGSIDAIIKDSIQEKEQTESIRIGLVTHSLLLRKDRVGVPDDVAIIEADSYRTKEAQKQRDEAILQGKTPILIGQYDRIVSGLDFASKELDLFFNPNECEFEKSFFDTASFFGKIKGRVDCIKNGKVINDLKVTTQTHLLDKKIFDFGYQLQMYIYMRLANVEDSNLVFFNPETFLVFAKRIQLSQVENECISLLKRAKENYTKLQQYKNKELGVIDCGEYATPQWAYQYLMEE